MDAQTRETLRPLEELMSMLVRKSQRENRPTNKVEREVYEACLLAFKLAEAPLAGASWQPVDNFNAPDERLMVAVDMNRKVPIPVLARWHRGHGWISVPGGYDFQPTHVREFDATLPASPRTSEETPDERQ